MSELKKITSGKKTLEMQLIEMKAGHAIPTDDLFQSTVNVKPYRSHAFKRVSLQVSLLIC
jgi:hypothetical protein